MTTEREIQNRFFWELRTHAIVLPNYTPARWYECDIFCITLACYMREYEIKLSVADFKADTRKGRRHPVYDNHRFTGMSQENKHTRLTAHDVKGPRQFWYVMPINTAVKIQPEDMPEWAGLFVIDTDCHYPKQAKPAPILHKMKADLKVVKHAFSVCYHRYWRERLKEASA